MEGRADGLRGRRVPLAGFESARLGARSRGRREEPAAQVGNPARRRRSARSRPSRPTRARGASREAPARAWSRVAGARRRHAAALDAAAARSGRGWCPFAAAPLDKPALVADAKLPPAPRSICHPCHWPRITVPAAGKPVGPERSRRARCRASARGRARPRSRSSAAAPASRRASTTTPSGAGERRATRLGARDRDRGALLAGRDLLPARPDRAGRLAIPSGRPGSAPGVRTVGALQQRLDGPAHG